MSGNEGMRELFVGISLKKSLFEGHKYPGYLIAPKTEERSPDPDMG